MRILDAYDLFIFDWDGTLVTSTPLVALGQITNRDSKLRLARRLRPKKQNVMSMRRIAIDEEASKLYSALADLYCALFRPTLKEGSLSALRLLKKRGKKVAIFSDSRYYRLYKEVRQLGIAEHMDFVLSAQSIGYYKPDPTGLLLISDKFKVPRKRCLYVCDMASDVVAARLAGMDACAVADGMDPAASLKRQKPKRIFASMAELLSALEG